MTEHDPTIRANQTVEKPEDLAALRAILIGPEQAELNDVSQRLDRLQRQLSDLPETLKPHIAALVGACLREAIAGTPEFESLRLTQRAGRALRRARHLSAATGAAVIVTLGAGALLFSGRSSRALEQQAQLSNARVRDVAALTEQKSKERIDALVDQVTQLVQKVNVAKLNAAEAQRQMSQARQAQRDAQTAMEKLQSQLENAETQTATQSKTSQIQLAALAHSQESLRAQRDAAQTRAAVAQKQCDLLQEQAQAAALQLQTLRDQSTALQKQLTSAQARPELTRYALAIGRDSALDFLNQQFGHVVTTQLGTGARLMGTRLGGSSALTIRVEKDKVLWAELTLALDPDTPAVVQKDNHALLAEFAGRFAPTWRSAASWLPQATQQVQKLGSKERLVRAADAFKISVSQTAAGATVVRIEPLQNDLENE